MLNHYIFGKKNEINVKNKYFHDKNGNPTKIEETNKENRLVILDYVHKYNFHQNISETEFFITYTNDQYNSSPQKNHIVKYSYNRNGKISKMLKIILNSDFKTKE